MRCLLAFIDRSRNGMAFRAALHTAVIPALGCALLLSGCKTFSPDGGMDAVAGIAGTGLNKDVIAVRTDNDALAARDAVERFLKRPLTADSAVQIALLNNRGLQAAYNELGIAEATMVA